jgi:transcriptional regulator with XRE-family HTH domain
MMKDNIGLRIKLARVAKDWTQQDLADKVNKTRPLITRIEQTGKGNYHTLRQICKVLDIEMEMASKVAERREANAMYQHEELVETISMLNSVIRTQQEMIKELKKEREQMQKQIAKLERSLKRR